MRDDLPSGTVTFLFTDVEGSTKLLHELGEEAYAKALAEHRLVLRTTFASHDGVEVDTQGDAFFYAFPTATGALEAASEGQQALLEGPIRVRLGLHTGSPLVTDEGYVGGDVHFAARVAACGHGGQVLLSKETHTLVAGGFSLTSLGSHRLKDVEEPVTIYQLGDGSFPRLKTIANSNLPTPTSSFLGREQELYDADGLLQTSRLLTVSGPGGQGKTRFALELATRAREERFRDYEDGIYSAFLSSLRDAELVPVTICVSLGVREEPGRSMLEALISHLQGKKLLLLLDNLEHLMEASSELSALLQACPGLTILATSRERLRIQGERVYPLPPLREHESVSLFCERAQSEPDGATGELCAKLEGLPLAIELAAARASVLTSEQILERLSQRLDFLKGGPDRDPRQETLRATIEWSFDLLALEEQRLFARLAVFTGGCTLQAVEEVCDVDVDTLQSLVEKSLLRFTDGRYWLLETIRELAAEKLEASGEAGALRQQHADYFLAVAQLAGPELKGPKQIRYLDELEADHANLRAALSHGLEGAGDVARAALLAVSLIEFWDIRCHYTEARHWFTALLDRRGELDPKLTADVLFGAAHVAHRQGDHAESITLYEAATEAHERTGNLARASRALSGSAFAHLWLGDVDGASACARRSLDAARADGDTWTLACAFAAMAATTLERGDHAEAEPLYEEGLRLFAEVGDGRNAAIQKLNLGCFAIVRRAYDRADSLLGEAATTALTFGDTDAASYARMHQAEVALRRGRHTNASPRLREALMLGSTSRNLVPRCLIGVGVLACRAGRTEDVARVVVDAEAILAGDGMLATGDDFWRQALLDLCEATGSRSPEDWPQRPVEDAVADALATLDVFDELADDRSVEREATGHE